MTKRREKRREERKGKGTIPGGMGMGMGMACQGNEKLHLKPPTGLHAKLSPLLWLNIYVFITVQMRLNTMALNRDQYALWVKVLLLLLLLHAPAMGV